MVCDWRSERSGVCFWRLVWRMEQRPVLRRICACEQQRGGGQRGQPPVVLFVADTVLERAEQRDTLQYDLWVRVAELLYIVWGSMPWILEFEQLSGACWRQLPVGCCWILLLLLGGVPAGARRRVVHDGQCQHWWAVPVVYWVQPGTQQPGWRRPSLRPAVQRSDPDVQEQHGVRDGG